MRTASLTIRNIPVHILERLKERAKRNHRSMQGEIIAILELAAIAPKRKSIDEVFAAMKATGLTSSAESAAIIRADRDAR